MTRDEICERFLEAVPYELYPVQEEALLAWFESDAGVLVCAPTGMGKTLIAEAAVFEALHTRKPVYYTTPLIALTEQKFRELGKLVESWGFSRDDVGFITGNRRHNPDAPVRVVVAEILLNHLLGRDGTSDEFEHVGSVVMDEFHNFNDRERGAVWELSLVLLPKHIRIMLLSATVGNPFEFADWLQDEHGRKLTVVTSNERRVPLTYEWVGEKLMTEFLPSLSSSDDAVNRTPALVFCFNRDECWEFAERLKGLPLTTQENRKQIESILNGQREALAEGAGPKLRQMLIRGVGVHHAGVLPRHKEIVEDLFIRKLIPFVICTETLAAGVNLPARSVVLRTLLKGKPRERKLIFPSAAHQMFGRAGRPQFDTQGYVYAIAHDDDAKIAKWKKKYDQIDPRSKDPGLMRARKQLERKKPSRRKTEQYWSEGQFKQLIAAGPARLSSRSMFSYAVLVYLLTKTGTLHEVREIVSKRFAPPDTIEKFRQQLDFMLDNLGGLGYLTRAEDGDHVTLDPSIYRLPNYRSVDPLYGEFLATELAPSSFEEKVLALESVLESPRRIIPRRGALDGVTPGPLQTEVLEPLLLKMGVAITAPEPSEDDRDDLWAEEQEQPPTFPEMLAILFESRLPSPEPVNVQPKWIAGGAFELDCDFFKFVRSRNLVKQEGLVLRHLLRLVILAGEFRERTGDPDYQRIAEQATRTCQRVDAQYTDRYLTNVAEFRNAATT